MADGTAIFVILKGKVMWGERISDYMNGAHGLPGGKVDEGETPEIAALRELFEETHYQGIKLIKLTEPTRHESIDRACHWYYCHVNTPPTFYEITKNKGWKFYDPKDPPLPLMPGTPYALPILIKLLESKIRNETSNTISKESE